MTEDAAAPARRVVLAPLAGALDLIWDAILDLADLVPDRKRPRRLDGHLRHEHAPEWVALGDHPPMPSSSGVSFSTSDYAG